MNISDAQSAVLRLKNVLETSIGEVTFKFQLHFPNLFFKEVWDKEIPAPGIASSSGVYLILDAEDRALYIGKATKNNLAGEIYNGKFKATTSVDPVRFDNSELAQSAPNRQLAENLRAGNVKLAAFVIDPPELSSLVEVYLQTLCWCRRDQGWWPPLNRQIG